MNPTRSFNLVKVLFSAVLAAGVCAGLANAQDYRGKFSLPFEARWGTAVLPPGDYTFEIDPASQHLITVRQGNGKGKGFVLINGITKDVVSGPSALTAVPMGGDYRIRMLHLAELGLTLEFMTPKAERRVLAQAPVLDRRLPVLMASK